ncbi:MAG TPA: OsmC family protein [Candidatus Cloacimonadota bacterium]|nr:OsmC family protein [Candidatus Cloacimonadota bacterium]
MAVTVFKSNVGWAGKSLVATGGTRNFQVTMDEPQQLGGSDTGMNPVEMVLTALGGCLVICGVAFARLCKVELKDISVELEGDLDTDGFLGKNPNVRNGFQEIRFHINIDSPSPQENIENLKKLIEERCPVSDTLKGTTTKAI